MTLFHTFSEVGLLIGLYAWIATNAFDSFVNFMVTMNDIENGINDKNKDKENDNENGKNDKEKKEDDISEHIKRMYC